MNRGKWESIEKEMVKAIATSLMSIYSSSGLLKNSLFPASLSSLSLMNLSPHS